MSQRSNKNNIINNSNLGQEFALQKRSAEAVLDVDECSVTESVLLYRLVFLSKKAVLLSVLLCLCFLIQPIEQVQANEEESDVVVVEVPGPAEVFVTQEDEEPELEQSEVNENQVPSQSTASNEDIELVIETVEVAEETEITPEETLNEDGQFSATNTEVASSTPTDESSTGSNDDNPDSESDSARGDNESNPADLEVTEDVTNINTNQDSYFDTEDNDTAGSFVSIVESDSHFAFTKDECTRIEDGSYYCQESGGSVELDDSLIAAPDVDGDLEIFLIKNGERFQITQNTVDDASPYYDEYSETIVWHRLVNDRYQIISFDVATGKETQITNTRVNNMEPARHGDYIVWQRWVDTNWEVILYDGKTEEQITNSQRHDIAPHIRGSLVIWNSQSNDGTQSLKTYDLKSKTFTTITDAEGVTVANPRMIVMYEALYENGDIVTKGFDLVSGEIVPLHSLPRELPTELPDSDSTGETRALIQNKPETRESDSINIPDDVDQNASSTAIIPDDTLDLRPATTTDEAETKVASSTTPIEIPDLVVTPVAVASSTATSTQPE